MNFNLRMRRVVIYAAFTLLFCIVVFLAREASSQAILVTQAGRRAITGNVPVFTFKYNDQITGENPNEVVLNTHNVNANQFGRLISYPVDGQIYAQPLYMPDVSIGGQAMDLVIVATENDSVYAFDADRVNGNTRPVWQTNFAGRGASTVPSSDVRCNDLIPKIGITSTPLIDSSTKTLFVVSYILVNGRFIYHLHALDLRTGHDKAGSPAEVHVPGTTFDSKMERQRAALLLANGRIYVAFGSFCDNKPYHGWIISYSYNGQGFHRLASLDDTPGGSEGGIWGSGGALAADQQGYIYVTIGNGTFDLNQGGQDAGDSYLKLSANLQMVDYFTPFNQQCLSNSDGDLGSGGPLLLPDSELISGGKDGRVYVVDTNHMGHFNTVSNACKQLKATNLDHAVQELPPHTIGSGTYDVPAYWNGPNGAYVFFSGVRDHAKAFRFNHGRLTGPTSATPEQLGFSGGNPVISSDGANPGTGILWLIDPAGYLRAYDATNLGKELYSTFLGSYVKFSTPIVSDGKVFVPTANALKIYGLLTNTPNNKSRAGISGTGLFAMDYDIRRRSVCTAPAGAVHTLLLLIS